MLGADEARAEHDGGVHRGVVGQLVRNHGEVRLPVGDDKVLGHVAVHLHGELVSAERPAALARVSALTVRPPARGGSGRGDALPCLEAGDIRADLGHDTHGLVTERPAVRHHHGATHGVHIGRAEQAHGGADQNVVRPRLWNGFLDDRGTSRLRHHECAHCLGHCLFPFSRSAGQAGSWMDFSCRNSSNPARPSSRPIPDLL